MRMDFAFARLSVLVCQLASSESTAKVSDFLPRTEEPVATEEDMKRMFRIKES